MVSVCCLVPASSTAQLKGENLLVAPPADFKVGYKGTNNGVNLIEWVSKPGSVLAATGRPETTMFRAIKGNDSFYVVQRAVRSVATPDQVEKMKKYLGAVSVCEAGSPRHPCPDLKPVVRSANSPLAGWSPQLTFT